MKSWIFPIRFYGYGETPEEAWENVCDWVWDGPYLREVLDPQQMPDAERNEEGDYEEKGEERDVCSVDGSEAGSAAVDEREVRP